MMTEAMVAMVAAKREEGAGWSGHHSVLRLSYVHIEKISGCITSYDEILDFVLRSAHYISTSILDTRTGTNFETWIRDDLTRGEYLRVK